MHHKLTRIFRQLRHNLGPCILLGIAIATTIGISLLFFYLLVWGVLIGSVICLYLVIKQYFFKSAPPHQRVSNRIINHENGHKSQKER